MLFNSKVGLVLLSAALAAATPTFAPLQQWENSALGKPAKRHTSPKPHVSCYPKTPTVAPPPPINRSKICYVKSHGNGTDDSSYIVSAVDECNNGGHVVFSEGIQYTIGTALNLTYLNSIDIGELIRANYDTVIRYLNVNRYPGLHSIYQRHGLLAGQRLQTDFPKCHHIFPVGRQ